MEDKILTKDGIKSIDELEKAERELNEVPIVKEVSKEVIQRESKYPPLENQIDTKKEIKNFNQNPNTKKLGVIAMKKSTYIGIWIFAGLVLLILLTNVIWFNVAFTKKDFTPNITNNAPEIPITNNYNNTNQNEHTIINNINNNLTLIMPEDFLIKLVNETS